MSGGAEPGRDPAKIEAQEAVGRQVERVRAEGVEVEHLTQVAVLGGPAGAINETAEACGADVIVAGTRGRTALTGLISSAASPTGSSTLQRSRCY